MQRILTAEQMRLADKFTIEQLGVSQLELVERAGKAVYDEIVKRFKGGRVLVCVGKGNNGEDGRVLARLLAQKHGFSVNVFSVSQALFGLFDKKYDIIIDCIFGTGLNRVVEGKYLKAIQLINKANAYVISCDIPSGINGTTGQIMGECVKANLTIAIQELKLGHFLGDAIDYCGEIVAKDIGISVWEEDCVFRLNTESIKKYFPKRDRNVHKGCFGKSVVIGGSKDFSGSVLLSMNALSALKMGVGYSTIVVPECLFNACIGLNPECILNSAPETNGKLAFDFEFYSKYLKVSSIVIGMGLGVSEHGYRIIEYFIKNYTGNLIIDADGLNCLSKFGVDILKQKKCNVVLTPHVLEFSRLSGIEKQEILANPIESAKDFAKEYNVIVLLKNSVSVITDGERTFLNTTGCSGMAKAGSGDVLSGVLAGVLANANDLVEGTAVGAYLFGLAGEKACKVHNDYTMTASDIISCFASVINSL